MIMSKSKKLESTETRLSKQPEIGKAYDDQMKDMEKRGFSQKLMDKEIAEWKGPVYYVLHHAILCPERSLCQYVLFSTARQRLKDIA